MVLPVEVRPDKQIAVHSRMGEETMLVLTRKRDDFIRIGSNIVIRVIKTAKGSVKIGIDAPSSVRVIRGEVATDENEMPLHMSLQLEDDSLEDCNLESLLVQN